jgi:hypothetical protein
MDSHRAGKGKLPSQKYEVRVAPSCRAAFHHPVTAGGGKPCPQDCAQIQTAADGLSYFPIQNAIKVLFPGVLLCLVHHLLQTFNCKSGHPKGLLCLSTRTLAKSKQQTTDRKINTME